MNSFLARKYETSVDYKIDRQLSTLFDTATEMKICMLDRTGRIIGWNRSAERLTGYSSREVMGKNYSIFISKDEVHGNIFARALGIATKKGEFSAEGIRVRKDGSHFWARVFITPMKEHGRVKFFVLITRDISKERAIQEKKDEFIGIASHELKNPITTLSLYSELLARRLELDRDKQNLRMLRDIQGQASRLSTLLDDLLVVNKLERGKLALNKEVFNIQVFLQTILRDLRSGMQSHRIYLQGAVSHNVRADKERIAQVFINLVTNAVKYSPHAKIVQVSVSVRRGKCSVSIRDFGSGIHKKDQRHIFMRYYRAEDADADNVGGTGLGLYISKEIIKRHRERLWLTSVLGKGSTFSFTLPCVL
jgi:PAS domain S-box-containing protein